jgi:adenylate kinase
VKLIILGAPGAGKGTQAEIIRERLGIPAISTGNIIREAIKTATEQGIKAKAYVEAGELVPDDIVIAMLQERIAAPDCEKGYILDGFPRNTAQARALDKMGVVIERVIDIEVSDAEIEQRLTGRRVCEGCGTSYHLEYKPPETPDTCDKCGERLTTRKDDEPATVRERLRVYHQNTEPLKDYYHAVGKLFVVQGQEEVADTTKLVLAALEA